MPENRPYKGESKEHYEMRKKAPPKMQKRMQKRAKAKAKHGNPFAKAAGY